MPRGRPQVDHASRASRLGRALKSDHHQFNLLSFVFVFLLPALLRSQPTPFTSTRTLPSHARSLPTFAEPSLGPLQSDQFQGSMGTFDSSIGTHHKRLRGWDAAYRVFLLRGLCAVSPLVSSTGSSSSVASQLVGAIFAVFFVRLKSLTRRRKEY